MGALSGLASVISRTGNIPTAAVLSSIYIYARLQSERAYLRSEDGSHRHRLSIRSWLASTRLARSSMRFDMSDGSRIRSRIVDGGALLSVHVDRDYDVPGVDWSAARAIIDIGAHVGAFTVWAARRAPNARLAAVEPNPETFELLVRNIRDNGLKDRVTAVNAAVGGEPGTGYLERTSHSLGTRIARSGTGPVRVRVQALVGLMAEARMDTVDVLKIDCEGMEYDALEAMGPDNLQAIRTLACEYHPEPGRGVQELDRLLHLAGFMVERPDAPLGVLWARR